MFIKSRDKWILVYFCDEIFYSNENKLIIIILYLYYCMGVIKYILYVIIYVKVNNIKFIRGNRNRESDFFRGVVIGWE